MLSLLFKYLRLSSIAFRASFFYFSDKFLVFFLDNLIIFVEINILIKKAVVVFTKDNGFRSLLSSTFEFMAMPLRSNQLDYCNVRVSEVSSSKVSNTFLFPKLNSFVFKGRLQNSNILFFTCNLNKLSSTFSKPLKIIKEESHFLYCNCWLPPWMQSTKSSRFS